MAISDKNILIHKIPNNKKYTLKFSKPDPRDFKFASPIDKATLPKATYNRKKWNCPIYDQLTIGACTGNTFAKMRSILELIQNKKQWEDLSRLFLYWEERNYEGTVSEDAGAEMRDGCKVLNKLGACMEVYYPYDVNNFTAVPTKYALMNAATRKIASYHSLKNLLEIKQCLAEGYPVALGFTVYEEFENVGKDGILKMPTKDSKILGGHAVTVVDFSDSLTKPNEGHLIIQNSWGKDWGDLGHFYMPYQYLTLPTTLPGAQIEAWTIR